MGTALSRNDAVDIIVSALEHYRHRIAFFKNDSPVQAFSDVVFSDIDREIEAIGELRKDQQLQHGKDFDPVNAKFPPEKMRVILSALKVLGNDLETLKKIYSQSIGESGMPFLDADNKIAKIKILLQLKNFQL